MKTLKRVSARRVMSLLAMAAIVSFVSYATQPDEQSQVVMSDLKFPEIPGLLPDRDDVLPRFNPIKGQRRLNLNSTPVLDAPTLPDQPVSLPCVPDVQSDAAAGGMIALEVYVPCAPNAVLRITHNVLEFDVVTDPDGRFSTALPALTSPAEIGVALADTSSVMSVADVPEVDGFHRMGLQWTGSTALEIHALEFGARPGSVGHVSATRPGSIERSLFARGGFMTHLGADGDTHKQATIYTIPAESLTSGVVRLSLQAAVDHETCGRTLSAEALQTNLQGQLTPLALAVEMPTCDSVGDILVLKNVLRDMKLSRM